MLELGEDETMYALEIINALNDPDNPAKPKGLNAKLNGAPEEIYTCRESREEAIEALDRREEHNISHYSGGRFRY